MVFSVRLAIAALQCLYVLPPQIQQALSAGGFDENALIQTVFTQHNIS
jgi:hypothetical protein